ncbi:MAG: hypothetical protein EOO05_18820 [Chitinophagaceae bacterium]|nr:MAG: hypothetical protein EOO05_18820 [Chitinophagaceae bacterium]
MRHASNRTDCSSNRIKIFFLLAVLASATIGYSQSPKPYGVLPSPAQLKWHEMEMYALIHYGVDTYTDKEWGYGDEDPAILDPASFSAEQIVAAAKAGGMKGVIVVAKHHDGLCLWPTKTTSHNISATPWKGGKGDMVKDYQLACQKLGMKLGVYCSPWDRNDARYGTREYVTAYREQLNELYTRYGPLFMSWHDGANGGDGYYGGTREKRQIDRSTYYGWDTIFAQVRRQQPTAVIFGDVGPDVRWVGNEEGYAGTTSWATYTPEANEEGKRPANGLTKYWLGTEGTLNGKYWMPAECDVPLRPGWFYHASQDEQVKSPYILLDLYYKSVGRGANLDLGLAPDRTGRLHKNDVQVLKEFGELLQRIFRQNLAAGASFTASNVRGEDLKKFGPTQLTDNDRYSYWATDDSVLTPGLVITLTTKRTFNVIRLRENIKLGQRITSFAIDVKRDNEWIEISSATSIGANRLIRLPQNVTASMIRLRITGSLACPTVSDFGLFMEPSHLTSPEITRNREGLVEITTTAPVDAVYYSLDGSEPTRSSKRYTRPFLIEMGGTVKATAFDPGTLSGETATRTFGLSTKNWKLTGDGSADNADRLIDGNPATLFVAPGKDSLDGRSVMVDLGGQTQLTGFSYLPRQDQKKEGTIHRYQFSVSQDGVNWTLVMEGEFANIASNPVEQVIWFNTAVTAGYIKLTAVGLLAGSRLTAAELAVFVARQ